MSRLLCHLQRRRLHELPHLRGSRRAAVDRRLRIVQHGGGRVDGRERMQTVQLGVLDLPWRRDLGLSILLQYGSTEVLGCQYLH